MTPPSDFWLVVEDDDNDFLLFSRACSSALDPKPVIHREKDGVAAKRFLSTTPETPKLVVSDLKMPQMNGLQLLQWLRQHSDFKQLRFVILSSSSLDQDVQASRKLGADDYRVKPTDFHEFAQVVKEVSDASQ